MTSCLEKCLPSLQALPSLLPVLVYLGLSLFATAQRTKEIGVRKVLGASVSNIVVLLSKDFIKLVIVAFVIASPVAWFIMHNWLQDFAYRINISWWIFFCRLACCNNCFGNNKFPGNKSGNCKPGEEFENGIDDF